jgi:hypothetical protein
MDPTGRRLLRDPQGRRRRGSDERAAQSTGDRVPAAGLGRADYNNPEATAQAFAGGWFHTGDIGYLDEDRFLFIVDRIKDLIIRGGYNVYPREEASARGSDGEYPCPQDCHHASFSPDVTAPHVSLSNSPAINMEDFPNV